MLMLKQIAKLKERLGTKDYKKSDAKLSNALLSFESENGLVIPADLAEYFKLLANTDGKIDIDLYEFYPVDRFRSVKRELSHWRGIPDYGNIVNTLEQCQNCFVFADHMFHLFTYA